MIRHLRGLSCLALLLALAFLASAYAQEAALSDGQVKERLGYIENALRAGQPRAGTWWYGWLATYSAGAVAGGILAGSHWHDTKLEGAETVPDREFAQDMLVGSGTFALGVVGLLIDPFTPAYAPKKLRTLPEATPEDRLARLKKAEEILRQCARREASGRSLTTHMLNIGANAAAGIVTAAAFSRPWTDGLINFVTGEAVSLLNIFTQPMRATRDLKDYEAKYLGKGGASAPVAAERRWTLSVWPGGLTFRLEF
jgi:hypothetical protein